MYRWCERRCHRREAALQKVHRHVRSQSAPPPRYSRAWLLRKTDWRRSRKKRRRDFSGRATGAARARLTGRGKRMGAASAHAWTGVPHEDCFARTVSGYASSRSGKTISSAWVPGSLPLEKLRQDQPPSESDWSIGRPKCQCRRSSKNDMKNLTI